MSSNYSPTGGRSRSGGGGRRRSSGSKSSYSKTAQGSPRGEERLRSHSSNRPSVQKKGFFAKLLSFLGLSGKKKPAATGQPQRTPRGAQSERRESSSPRQSRKPERIEVTTPRVYVGNLSFDASESDLLELFSGVGSVQNVEVVCNRETHRSKGFGFVTLSSIEEAKRAVAELHDKEYMTRKLVVSGAKAVAESRSERSERRDTVEASETSGTSTPSEAAAA
jgi:hypothetical protein